MTTLAGVSCPDLFGASVVREITGTRRVPHSLTMGSLKLDHELNTLNQKL